MSAVEEAIFFHGVARDEGQPAFQVKGDNPRTEHYSMLGPEVLEGPDGDRLDRLNTDLVDALLTFDAVVVAGQAKSHCVAWTIDDLITGDEASVRRLAEQTYLLEGLHLLVVVPGVVDYTESADEAFARYEAAGHERRALDRPARVVAGRARRSEPEPRRKCRGPKRAVRAVFATDLGAGPAVSHHDVGREIVRAADQR